MDDETPTLVSSKMRQITLLLLGLSLLTCAPSPSHAGIIFKSTVKKSISQLIILNDMEQLLQEADNLRQTVTTKGKDINDSSQRMRIKAEETIKNTEQKLKQLIEDLKQQGELKISALKERIKRREGKKEILEKALEQESKVVKATEIINKFAFNKLGFAAKWVRSWDEAGRDQTETVITEINKKLQELNKELIKENEAIRNILTTPEYQDEAKIITQEQQEAIAALADIQNIVMQAKKEKIFNVHNDESENLIDTLKAKIKQAKCSKIKTMADLKPNVINDCKLSNLEKIKKGTKIGVCKSLNLESSNEDLKKCAQSL